MAAHDAQDIPRIRLSELAKASGISKRGLLNQAENESWPYEVRTGKGGKANWYAIAALPEKLQVAAEEFLIGAKPAPAHEARDGNLAGGETTPGAFSQAMQLSGLAEFAKGEKFRLSPAMMEDPATWKKLDCLKQMREADYYGKRGSSKTKTAEALAAKYGVKRRVTIYRWMQEAEGWIAKPEPKVPLAKELVTLPKSRAFEEAALKFGLATYGQNIRRGQKWAYGQLEEKAAEQGWKIGDYTSFHRLLGQIPDAIWDICRRGMTAFERDYVPKNIRAWLQAPVYSVLCGDQNVDDFLTYAPYTGAVFTMNYYLWIDCTSRAWTGMWPSFGPYSRFTFAYALRMACELGFPQQVYHDNGGPETSKDSLALIKGLSNTVQFGNYEDFSERFRDAESLEVEDGKEGVERRLSRPGIPWHKPIEPQMNLLKRYRMDAQIPGYRQRQAEPWEGKVVEAELKKMIKAKQIWTIERQLEEHLAIMARHNAHVMRLREGGGTRIIPQEVLRAGLAQQSRVAPDAQTLDMLFMPRRERTVMQSTVTVGGLPDGARAYSAMELSRLTQRAGKKGERVMVHVDPFDETAPAIISIAGEFYCLAERRFDINPVTRDGLADSMKEQRTLLKMWRGEVEKIVGLNADGKGLVRQIGGAAKLASEADKARAERQEMKTDAERAAAKILSFAAGQGRK